MPVYEYQCRTCDTRFEVRRPMSEAAASAPCPAGHDDTTRVLSVFASVGTSAAAAAGATLPGGGPAGGCGQGCRCAAGQG